jgi:pyrimidine operon attenuation protein/uracil phosphoribosyltransferase
LRLEKGQSAIMARIELKSKLMDKQEIDRALERIALEILEASRGTEDLVLVGIRTRGVYLAQRLAEKIKQREGVEIPVGILDITLYRDDLTSVGPQPIVRKTEIPFRITSMKVVLVDDVLYTGRTIRAALDALIDFGRPQTIQLAVLVDRGRRELPIRWDYVGLSVKTTENESVKVMLEEVDGAEEVQLRTVEE